MNAQEQITKLQGLLARIQRNAAKPHAPAATPSAAAPSPVAVATASVAPAAVDQSVDDLLSASPLPVDVDVALDSIPPAAVSAPAEVPDAEPIPLVSVAAEPAAPAAPEPSTDDFSLESEVSEVRVAALSREPAVEVTVAAIEAEAEPLGTEELSEEDLVEVDITDLTSSPPPAGSDVDIDFDDEEEQPPASSQRQVASTLDEALAAAAAELDADREPPLMTPPPESGPQEAPATAATMTAPPAPDVDALLGQELDIPTRESTGVIPVAPAAGPTPEQLGQTVDLDEARGPTLELAEAPVLEVTGSAEEELEVALPGREPVGGYTDDLLPPPEARDELEAHRRRLDEDLAPPPESLAQLPSVQPSGGDVAALGAPAMPFVEAAPAVALEAAVAAPLSPEITARPVAYGSPETFATLRESPRPRSFVELLDASLALNGD